MRRPDVIVIGAGSAGCALAGRLAASGERRVLLLEAGSGNRHPLITAPIAWPMASIDPRFGWGYQGESEQQLGGRGLDMPRGRLMGGTASINGMMYSRGQREDYDGWHAQGLDGWSYADVLPYFRRTEANWRGSTQWHGGGGPVAVTSNRRFPRLYDSLLAAARELGFDENEDFNGASQAGFGIPDFTVRRTRRESSATAYLKLPQVERRLAIRRQVQVLRIIVERGRATGVELLQPQGPEVLQADEIVLAVGTFNSPHLLLLSGIGAADALRRHGIDVVADLPAVGRNLQDHPMLLMAYAASAPLGFEERLRLDRLAGSALAWLLRIGGLLDEAPLGIQGFVNRTDPAARPDTQFQVAFGSPMSRPWLPGWRKASPDSFGVGALQLDPQGRGVVELKSSDPRELPAVRSNFLLDARDRQAAREMFAFVRRFFATTAMQKLTGVELIPGATIADEADIDRFIANSLVSGAHPVGTCAMGNDPASSVVDSVLRVHGIDGLRIADASIMPTIIRGNTSAPAMMIGDKAADLMLGRKLPRADLPPARRATDIQSHLETFS
jgi:choline dehydrogenase